MDHVTYKERESNHPVDHGFLHEVQGFRVQEADLLQGHPLDIHPGDHYTHRVGLDVNHQMDHTLTQGQPVPTKVVVHFPKEKEKI